jgi:phytanoyl-CoA hydroxylase
MLPTRYYPSMKGNIYEQLTASIARQLFPQSDMTKDYDQLLNKRPGKSDAIFSWHQDMAYWPNSKVLKVDCTDTCTFSLAIDDSTPENGCLRYVVGSGATKALRPHRPAAGDSREDGHALATAVDENEEIRLAAAKRGSLTIHDEWVVHGSSGNTCKDKERRTYVLAYRAAQIVAAERKMGFTHSHNDDVNWDTFYGEEDHAARNNDQKQLNKQL